MPARTLLFLATSAVLASCQSATGADYDPPGFLDDTTARWVDIGKACTPSSPATTVAQAGHDVPTPDQIGPVGSYNRLWADAARGLPGGLGGGFLRRDTAWVWLVDPGKLSEVVAGLGTYGIAPPPGSYSAFAAKQARWDFEQMAEWYTWLYLQPGFRAAKFNTSDIQEGSNRLEFGVTTEADRAAFDAVVSQFDLPCYLVATVIRGPTVFTARAP